jgi:glutamine amidotransferase
MISIIDYGMGNLKSIQNALKYIGKSSVITRDKNEIENSKYIILPGVGSFNLAMSNIKNYGLDQIIKNEVVSKQKNILGICLGMQLLANKGEEDGDSEGLGLINGEVKKIKQKKLPLPHIGFNLVDWKTPFDLNNLTNFYFVHSYHFIPKNYNEVMGTSLYDDKIVSAVKHKNIIGVQFHPEKSQSDGLMLLKTLIENNNYA